MTELIGSELAKRIDTALQRIEDDPRTPMLRAWRGEVAKRGRDTQLIVYNSSFARPRIYCGEWIIDCPRDGCSNAEYATDKNPFDRGIAGKRGVKKTSYHCSYCHYFTTNIQWPANADELLLVLERRPMAHNRNWYPEGHPEAVALCIPDGQTVEELLTENHEHGVY